MCNITGSTKPKGRISQETFDDAVRENQTEFEMDLEEAIADAITEFELCNIDLSTVIKTPAHFSKDKDSGSGHEGVDLVNEMKALLAKEIAGGADVSTVEANSPTYEATGQCPFCARIAQQIEAHSCAVVKLPNRYSHETFIVVLLLPVRKLTAIVKTNKSDIHIIGSYDCVGTLVNLIKEHPTAPYVALVFQLLSILVRTMAPAC